MSDLDEVLAAVEASIDRCAAVATVVQVRGSAYRREGARLVVPPQGEPVGTISAGCLEADVAEVARQVLATGRARLVTFDTAADTDDFWGWGLGCLGVIDVLVEPPVVLTEVVPALHAAKDDDRALALVSAVNDGRVARILVDGDGAQAGRLSDGTADAEAADAARRALHEGMSRWTSLATGWDAFVEVIEPAPCLAVCGAGPGAVPLVEFALRLGWRVEVVDHRPAMLDHQAFRDCHRVVVTERERAAEQLGPHRRRCVVVMTHNFAWDLDYLGSFLGGPFAYLGVVGPRRRLEVLVEGLEREGVECGDGALGRVQGPAGLDIGAEGPDEIAWAIMAEMTAVRRGVRMFHAQAGDVVARTNRDASAAPPVGPSRPDGVDPHGVVAGGSDRRGHGGR